MSYPVLHTPEELAFKSNGVGVLSDAISCLVTEERNGLYELAMQYPVHGIYFDKIVDRSIILCQPNKASSPQPFRVYRIAIDISGVASIYARHISYDLTGAPVRPYTASNVGDALIGLKSNILTSCPFHFDTDKTTRASFNQSVPTTARALLGGQSGSILDVYGGEYEFDGLSVFLHEARGKDRGVVISYGKNLLSFDQDQNSSNVYTGIYPYWVSVDSELLTLPEETITIRENPYDKILAVDFSADFEEKPSVDDLRNRARSYMTANTSGDPEVSIQISFANLAKTQEYKNIAALETVDLCDMVTVLFPTLGAPVRAKAVSVVYDGIRERYDTVTLGSARRDIADSLKTQRNTTQQLESFAKKLPGIKSKLLDVEKRLDVIGDKT